MDERIYQIAEQIVEIHQKPMSYICRWLKMCAVELCQKMNCRVCWSIYWILHVMKKY